MIENNYSAWDVNSNLFSEDWSTIEKLKFFARYALLAPSGHNTQPWQFSSNDEALLLKADFSRRLPYSGIQANEPYVSLGACLGTLELAAKGFGYHIAIKYIFDNNLIASITLSGRISTDPSLLTAITERVSNRNYYDKQPLPDGQLSRLIDVATKHVTTLTLSEREDINYIADLTVRSTHTTMGDKAFRAELSKWVRNNLTRQYDGMPGFVQGIPTPVSMFAKQVIKNVDVSKDQAKKDSQRVIESANLVIISVDHSDPDALTNGGKAYAQICILAQQQHIASAGIGAAIIDPQTRNEIIAKYKLTGKPIGIIRLGIASKMAKHSPRRPFSLSYN